MTWARECEHCGGPIPDHKRASAMFCSKRCSVASSNAAIAAARLEAKAGRWCEWCGDPIPARLKIGARFCCVPCQRQARYHAEIEARPVQTCPVCGGGFRPVRHDDRQTYCSRQCAQETYRITGPINCTHCGTTIATPRRGQKFCNSRCQDRWHEAKRRQARRA